MTGWAIKMLLLLSALGKNGGLRDRQSTWWENPIWCMCIIRGLSWCSGDVLHCWLSNRVLENHFGLLKRCGCSKALQQNIMVAFLHQKQTSTSVVLASDALQEANKAENPAAYVQAKTPKPLQWFRGSFIHDRTQEVAGWYSSNCWIPALMGLNWSKGFDGVEGRYNAANNGDGSMKAIPAK